MRVVHLASLGLLVFFRQRMVLFAWLMLKITGEFFNHHEAPNRCTHDVFLMTRPHTGAHIYNNALMIFTRAIIDQMSATAAQH